MEKKVYSTEILNTNTCPWRASIDSSNILDSSNKTVEIKIDNLTLTVKLECLHSKKSDLLACGRCKVIMYCNINCQKNIGK